MSINHFSGCWQQVVHPRRDEQRLRLRARQPARCLYESVKLHRLDRQRDCRAYATQRHRGRRLRRYLLWLRSGGEQAGDAGGLVPRPPLPARRVSAFLQCLQRLPRVLRRQRRVAVRQDTNQHFLSTRSRLIAIHNSSVVFTWLTLKPVLNVEITFLKCDWYFN